jgi:two-component system sensor histidine kinase KdpD
VSAFLVLNWFFTPPIHTFTIGNGRDLLALISFLVVAGVISALVDVAARRQSDAYRARGEAQALALMSGTLLQDPEPLPKLTEQLTKALALDGASVLARANEESPWHIEASSGTDPPTDPEAAMLAVALGENRVLALRGRYLRAEHRELIGPFATQITLAIQGRRLQAEAATASSLVKANELRTALLAAVSHDLRTPLASIRAAATALLSEEIQWEPSATKEVLRTIDDEADRLNTLVGNLLDMSRLQTGTFTIHTRLVGVDEVVGAALLSLHSPPERIEVDVSETLPPLNADAGLLERAIANLLENAVRFSPAGRPVRIEAARVDELIQLKVIDHGPGIPLADRERVFQAFQRLGDQPNGTGVGLGLAVAKGLTEAVGGSVEIEDTPGGGCTMVVKLPVAS